MKPAALLLIAACGQAPVHDEARVAPLAEHRHVAIVGDSTALPWPGLLQELRPDLFVSNHAVSGAETAAIANVQWALNVKPLHNVDALIVLGGVNDVFQLHSVDAAISNLLTLYDDAQSLGVDVYAITTIPPVLTVDPSYSDGVARIVAAIRTAPVTVIDIADEFVAHQEWMFETAHQTPEGQAVIARAVAEALP